MKPTTSLLPALLWPLTLTLTLAAPVPEPKDTLSVFTYRLTLFSSASCGHSTTDSSPSASLTVTPSGPNNHFTKPLPPHPKSVRVQALNASCRLALVMSNGMQVPVTAAGGCMKLPAGNEDGEEVEGFVRVVADCDA